MSKEDAVERIMEITVAGVHYALDTTASSKVIRQAVDSLTLRGQCGLVGASSPGSEISLDAMHLMTAGRKVRGIVEGDSAPDIFIPQLIELQKQGRFPTTDMLTFYDMERHQSSDLRLGVRDGRKAHCPDGSGLNENSTIAISSHCLSN
jgi:aryl-alcohol dehydrogenase